MRKCAGRARFAARSLLVGVSLWMVGGVAGGAEGELTLPPTADADVYSVPATPVGKQLTWVLRCINQRAVPDAQGRFTKRFLEQFTLEQVQELLSSLRDRTFKGAEVVLVEPDHNARPDTMTCTVGNEATDRYLSLLLSVDDQTGLIAGMSFAAGLSNSSDSTADIAVWDELRGDAGSLQNGVWFGAYEIILSGEAPGRELRIAEVYAFGTGKRLHLSSLSRVYVLLAVAEKYASEGEGVLTAMVPSVVPGEASSPCSEWVKRAAGGDLRACDALLAWLGRAAVARTLAAWQEQSEYSLPYLSFAEYRWLRGIAAGGVRDRYMMELAADQRAWALDEGGEVARELKTLRDEGRLGVLQMEGEAPWQQPRSLMRLGWLATNRELAYAVSLLRMHEAESDAAGAALSGLWRVAQPMPVARPEGAGVVSEAKLDSANLAAAGAAGPAPLQPRGLTLDAKVWSDSMIFAGAEPGVASLACVVQRHDGRWFTLVMAWNNEEQQLDEPRLYELAERGLDILAREGREVEQKADDGEGAGAGNAAGTPAR